MYVKILFKILENEKKIAELVRLSQDLSFATHLAIQIYVYV